MFIITKVSASRAAWVNTSLKKGTSMSYVGTKKIKGKKYYNLGHGEIY
ncbi:Protein of unknown function [Lactobacillus helveticus CIRM-BIA 103]|nr:Protein of unknown function [Lactobacillus helveticus CIRM-BIA 103]